MALGAIVYYLSKHPDIFNNIWNLRLSLSENPGDGAVVENLVDTNPGGGDVVSTDPVDTNPGGEDVVSTDPVDTNPGGEDVVKEMQTKTYNVPDGGSLREVMLRAYSGDSDLFKMLESGGNCARAFYAVVATLNPDSVVLVTPEGGITTVEQLVGGSENLTFEGVYAKLQEIFTGPKGTLYDIHIAKGNITITVPQEPDLKRLLESTTCNSQK